MYFKKRENSGKILLTFLGLGAVVAAIILGLSFYFSTSTIHELLTSNHELAKAIENLTEEEQIGYATLESQRTDESGRIVSVVRFVQTAVGAPREIVSEQLFEITGDIVHFDALIVKFPSDSVKAGTDRALYLWRRIHGEGTEPAMGQAIQEPGESPERYHALTKSLRLKDRTVFWDEIWSLANDPQRLSEYGISAVYGNTVYSKMEKGKVYRFKINTSGQIYPEVLNILD
ncbi:MAG: hypothetical protein AAGH40_09430 [Verrucomicrobiota bacterium]